MKKILLLTFFIFIFPYQTLAQKINVVIDIDHTLAIDISKFQNIPEITLNNRVIEMDDVIYAFYDGADEFIKHLLINPDIVITFFSNGMKQRNEKLINQFFSQIFTQIECLQIKNRIKFLSREDCLDGNINPDLQPKTGKFRGNRKKDLKIIEGHLDWTILIDDDPSYIVRDQERNFLFVEGGNCFNYPKYLNKGDTKSRNHLIYALGIFLTALNQSYQNKTTLVDELHRIQFDDSKTYIYGNYSDYEKPNQKIFYELGLNALKEINPNVELFLPRDIHPWNE